LELTDQQREGVDAAIEELDSGKGISHQEVMKKLRKKYSPE
jgi:predicted transcriptional regulator